MFTITIGFESAGREVFTVDKIPEGKTILQVCLEQGTDIRYECGGVCSCTTCHIFVEAGADHLEEQSVREMHFLQRLENKAENSRLSCQCLLQGKGGEVVVKIPEKFE